MVIGPEAEEAMEPSIDEAASMTDGPEEPAILEEIEVEDLAVDGICGVY